MRKLKTGFPGVPAHGARDTAAEIPGIVALGLRKIIGVLHGVIVGDGEGGQTIGRWIVRQPGDAQVRKHVGAECIGRQIEDTEAGEREVCFIHPRRARERMSERNLLRS